MVKKEKRTFTRIQYKYYADLSYDRKTLPSVPIKDISLKGCFIVLKKTSGLKLDHNVKLQIKLDKGLIVHLSGRIIRIDNNGIAVYFSSVDMDSFYHLRKIVELYTGNPKKIEQELIKFIEMNR